MNKVVVVGSKLSASKDGIKLSKIPKDIPISDFMTEERASRLAKATKNKKFVIGEYYKEF